MKRFLLIFLLMAGLSACNNGQKEQPEAAAMDASSSVGEAQSSPGALAELKFMPPMVKEESSMSPEVGSFADSAAIPSKRITQGSMSMASEALPETRAMVDSLCRKYKGWVAGESQTDEPQRLTMNLDLRIPAAHFQAFTKELEQGKRGKVVHKSVSSEDITAQYVDNESRLASERAYLERYRAMLQKANTVKEMLEIEERIRMLTEEMESRIGQRKVWDRQVSYSSLSLEIFELKPYVYQGNEPLSFVQRFKESFFNGGQNIVGFFLMVISWWPFLLVFAGLYWFWRRRKK